MLIETFNAFRIFTSRDMGPKAHNNPQNLELYPLMRQQPDPCPGWEPESHIE